jgi:hypothetical protein
MFLLARGRLRLAKFELLLCVTVAVLISYLVRRVANLISPDRTLVGA